MLGQRKYCGDGSLDVKEIKSSARKRRISGLFRKLELAACIPRNNVNVEEFKKLFTKWGVYTYSKLLSEQIFEPLDEKDNKSLMYDKVRRHFIWQRKKMR